MNPTTANRQQEVLEFNEYWNILSVTEGLLVSKNRWFETI